MNKPAFGVVIHFAVRGSHCVVVFGVSEEESVHWWTTRMGKVVRWSTTVPITDKRWHMPKKTCETVWKARGEHA